MYSPDISSDCEEGDPLSHAQMKIIAGQRLFDFIYFFETNALALSDLTLVPELNGVKFGDLTPRMQRKFNRTSIRTRIFENVNEETIKYLIKTHR